MLLAGGIGVTPLVAMVARLRTTDAEFTMHDCTRSPEKTPIMETLSGLVAEGRVVSITKAAIRPQDPTSRRCSNHTSPAPTFMTAAEMAATDWPDGTVHFE